MAIIHNFNDLSYNDFLARLNTIHMEDNAKRLIKEKGKKIVTKKKKETKVKSYSSVKEPLKVNSSDSDNRLHKRQKIAKSGADEHSAKETERLRKLIPLHPSLNQDEERADEEMITLPILIDSGTSKTETATTHVNADEQANLRSEDMTLTWRALKYVKNRISTGAGNIITDIIDSEMESLGRSDYARDLFNEAKNKHKEADQSTSVDKEYENMLRAAAAYVAQGGNCHEHAALTFSYLMRMTDDIQVEICKVKMKENAQDYHVFVRMKAQSDTQYIVDPWGKKPEPQKEEDVLDNDQEVDVLHSNKTNKERANAIWKECIALIKNTATYENKNEEEKQYKIYLEKSEEDDEDVDEEEVVEHPFKCPEGYRMINYKYLKEDKMIGNRGKMAYDDPTLNREDQSI